MVASSQANLSVIAIYVAKKQRTEYEVILYFCITLKLFGAFEQLLILLILSMQVQVAQW